MLSNSNNSSNQKTFTLPTYINKKIHSKINTRYGNVQNKSSAPIAYNIQNNQFLYKSENRKAINQSEYLYHSIQRKSHFSKFNKLE